MATAQKLTLSDLPARTTLPDGSQLLAEADAFRVLEGGPLKEFGGLVSPQKLQLVRLKGDDGRVKYELVIEPAEAGCKGGASARIALDARCRLEPKSVSGLRVSKHVVKPEGESVLKAVLNSEGEDVELVVLQVSQAPESTLQGLLGRSGHDAAIGFKNPSEAKAWLIYLSAVLGIMDEKDGQTFEAMCAKQVAGHQARALGPIYDGLVA